MWAQNGAESALKITTTTPLANISTTIAWVVHTLKLSDCIVDRRLSTVHVHSTAMQFTFGRLEYSLPRRLPSSSQAEFICRLAALEFSGTCWSSPVSLSSSKCHSPPSPSRPSTTQRTWLGVGLELELG